MDKVNRPAVSQTPMGAAAQAIDTFRNIAKSPSMTLPTFDGTIIEYAPFKKKFMWLVEHVSGPPTLRATYLENSLRGEARRYMGTKSDYFGEYDEMWRLLDDKYANRWVLASDTIREFFGKPPPQGTQEDVNEWFWDQIDSFRGVLNLGMTLEQVGVNILTQSLPIEFGARLRDGLRQRDPGNKTFAFSLDQIRSVYNDTVSIKNASGATEPLGGTLSFHTAVLPTERQNRDNRPPIQQTPGRGSQRVRGSLGSFNLPAIGRGQGFHGNNRGRGDGGWHRNRLARPLFCSVCDERDASGHPSVYCPNFPTAEAKRRQLQLRNKCIACTATTHQGPCPEHLECRMHRGERHYEWLCGGDPYPGRQEA